MAKGPTKEQLVQENLRLKNMEQAYMIAIRCLISKDIDHIERCKMKDGDRYTLRLIRAAAPHGGILLITYHYGEKSEHTSVRYLDDVRPLAGQHLGSRVFPSEHHEACSALEKIFAVAAKLQQGNF